MLMKLPSTEIVEPVPFTPALPYYAYCPPPPPGSGGGGGSDPPLVCMMQCAGGGEYGILQCWTVCP